MKKSIMLGLGVLLAFTSKISAQDEVNTITTAVPFLNIAGDARASGLGEQGVATSADVYAVQWNPAKLAFLDRKVNIGVVYTPYLSQLVNDLSLIHI